MSSIVNGFIIFSLTITLLYFVGLLSFISDHEDNKCDMTFMYEYPQFVKIWNKIDEQYPKYGLYAYSEGRLTEKTRNMYFDGIPVLFIPGNGGSHRQVRSLASVALRKAYNSRTPYHFDYFSIDLNEELSGLNGALLIDQLHYANASLYRLLELYQGRRNAPKSIILFGHSMGGLIARRLVAMLPQDSTLIPIVLTLASPHKRSPLLLDVFSYNFYNYAVNQSIMSKTVFVSVNGGYSDFLVPAFLTNLDNENDFNVVTTHIPKSWLPADHLCILWCKQTILILNRALFDAVDPKTRQISTNINHIREIFHHHLVHNSGIKSNLLSIYETKTHIRNDGEWIENLARQYTIHLLNGTKNAIFYMVRLLKQPQHEALTVVAINMETIDWVYICGAHIPRNNQRVCEEFTHLTHLSEISPSIKYKRRTLRLNLHEIMENKTDVTHVVMRVLPTNEPIVLNVDVYNVNERKTTINLPHLFNLRKQLIIEKTIEKAIHYELVLPQLTHLIQYYQLFVDHVKCSNQFHHTTASLIVPWGYQNSHKNFIDGDHKPLVVRLYESKPQWAHNQSVIIQLTLDPNCRYRVSIRSYLPGVLGQLARFYSPLLLVNISAVILMALNSQLKSLANEHTCSIFFLAVKEGAKPYYILTGVKLISRFISIKPLVNILPTPDWLLMSQEGTDFFLLPLLLYICSVGIVWLLGLILCGSLIVFETTVHKLVLKFLARTVTFTVHWSDYVISALHKLPFVVATILVTLALTTTGSLALCVGMIFYFMRLAQLSQDYIEELVWYYLRKLSKKIKPNDNNNDNRGVSVHDSMFFHATLFLLWSIITFINIPSVLTWAHNFKFTTILKPDPSFMPGLVLSICSLPLWQLDLPKKERGWYTELGYIVAIYAIISLIYAPISIFRLNYTLTGAIVFVVLHQLLAPNRTNIIITETNIEQNNYKDRIKAKLE